MSATLRSFATLEASRLWLHSPVASKRAIDGAAVTTKMAQYDSWLRGSPEEATSFFKQWMEPLWVFYPYCTRARRQDLRRSVEQPLSSAVATSLGSQCRPRPPAHEGWMAVPHAR
jgi:hypothetical protein